MSLIRNIYSKPMQRDEAGAVYAKHGHRDFPPDELKPFSLIGKLMDSGCYECCGFYDKENDDLCAYAFMMADADTNMLLLDYFAVCEEVRQKGYGSAAIELLKNGVVMTGQKSSAFGVDFKLMVMNLGNVATENNVGYFLEGIYRKMLPENLFREQFRLR